jgi:C4-type Zn-finger protein
VSDYKEGVTTVPCPFCGGLKIALKQSRLCDVGFCGNAKVWYVYCFPCAIRGPIKETSEQAVTAWEERKP